jgi:hypothetical protein
MPQVELRVELRVELVLRRERSQARRIARRAGPAKSGYEDDILYIYT